MVVSARTLLVLALIATVIISTVPNPASAMVDSPPPTPSPQAYTLATWMGALAPYIGNRSLLELSLPGTHDSMTYDLSTTVADDANDLPPAVAKVLHDLHDLAGLAGFVREQARTQVLNLTEQLDNGIRFVDFRVTYSAGPNASSSSSSSYDWYCLHLVQSNRRALEYLQELSRWVEAHPTEVVVLWVSRHGSPCGNEYPGVSALLLKELLGNITDLFGDRLVRQPLNSTTLGSLVCKGQRVALYLSSYDALTGGAGTDMATDACGGLDNELGGGDVYEETTTRPRIMKLFRGAEEHKRKDAAANNSLFLQSMAGGGPSAQILDALLVQYFKDEHAARRCALAFNIPNMSSWCPPTLLEISQLANYYNQFVLQEAARGAVGLPAAIYLDGVDVGGVIRTGTGRFDEGTTGFAYVDTVALYNLLASVGGACAANDGPCAALVHELDARIAKNPMRLWNDAPHGRHTNWP